MAKHQPIELKMSFHEHYVAMWPFIKPYTLRALLAILISIPIGAMVNTAKSVSVVLLKHKATKQNRIPMALAM